MLATSVTASVAISSPVRQIDNNYILGTYNNHVYKEETYCTVMYKAFVIIDISLFIHMSVL